MDCKHPLERLMPSVDYSGKIYCRACESRFEFNKLENRYVAWSPNKVRQYCTECGTVDFCSCHKKPEMPYGHEPSCDRVLRLSKTKGDYRQWACSCGWDVMSALANKVGEIEKLEPTIVGGSRRYRAGCKKPEKAEEGFAKNDLAHMEKPEKCEHKRMTPMQIRHDRPCPDCKRRPFWELGENIDYRTCKPEEPREPECCKGFELDGVLFHECKEHRPYCAKDWPCCCTRDYYTRAEIDEKLQPIVGFLKYHFHGKRGMKDIAERFT